MKDKLASGVRVVCRTQNATFAGVVCGNTPDKQGRWLISQDYGDGWLVPEHQIEVIRSPWRDK
jgi:hypothetical protein